MMEPSWVAMKWITGFGAYGMGEPLILARINSPDDQSMNNQLGPSTTTPIATTNFNLNSSQCVVGTIKIPISQLSSLKQNKFSSSQLSTSYQKN